MFTGKCGSRFAVACASAAILAIAIPMLSQRANAGPNVHMLGAENQSKQISVTFWLKQRDQAGFDRLVRQMYDRTSPNYHHWLTVKQFDARFAPGADDMATVKKYLAAHNLQVVRTDRLNLAVTARGSVADVERATGVQLNRAVINGEARRLASGTPMLQGAAGKLVYAVQGLTDTRYHNHVARPIDPDTHKPVGMAPVAQGVQKYFNAYCMRDTETQTFKQQNPSEQSQYTGTRYGDYIYAGPPHLPPCGYDSPQIQKAYGLTSLYKKGLDGTGQTIVIVDAFGSDTITTDANTFAQINALPGLDSTNFTIYYPTGPTNCGGNTCGWDVETSLDVEWSHTVAPGASIALVLAADNSSTNLDLSILFAIETGLGPVISNSWGIPEAELIAEDPGELIVEDSLNAIGAALGVSVNFSSGDSGDYLAAYGAITVEMPSSSPHATSVGGTSLFLNHDKTIKMQTGWGNNITRVASYNGQPLIPPEFLGFTGGAGGGASAAWPKPAYQNSLPGNWRQVPDIAYLADPFTGGEVVDTENGTQSVGVVGGTSLACPMFSAMWAIATQAAGEWLGQAAPLLYALPSDAFADVVALDGPDNVTGWTDLPPDPPVNYSAADLVAPLENTTDFVSLLYQGTTTRWYALGFGTDTSLTTGPGWDNVTGLGTPNGASFVNAIAGK
jgi:subtilase family serine protease